MDNKKTVNGAGESSPAPDGSQCAFRQQGDGSYLTDCGLSVSRYIDTARPCPKCHRDPQVIARRALTLKEYRREE